MRFHPTLSWLFLAWPLAGCGDSPTASHPDRVFTDAQRSSCPANPFGPSDPIAPKRAASAILYDVHLEIYSSRGKFIRDWEGQYDPTTTGASRSPYSPLAWDGRDESGKEVASGYYFMVMTTTFPGISDSKTEMQCFFRVNPADQGKVRTP